jgi:hypothetical protein
VRKESAIAPWLQAVTTWRDERLTKLLRGWYADGLMETLRDQPHLDEIAQVGRVLEDLRAT